MPMRFLVPALALAAPATTQVPNWAKGTPITVTMTNHGFSPARLTLRRSGAYTVRFRNPSDRTHTFTAKSFFAQARVSPADQAWISKNEIELKAGQNATLHLIAPDTPRAIYPYRSTRLEDATAKMKGEIHIR